MQTDEEEKIHYLSLQTDDAVLPERFTCPFHYTPHPLTERSAAEVQHYLETRTDWKDELHRGKMFGVLIVRTHEGRIGYLAAFSGNLAGSNHHAFFVPPVYDLLRPDGFFRIEEEQISAINRQIEELEASDDYRMLKIREADCKKQSEMQLNEARIHLKRAKAIREERRKAGISESENATLIRESQFQKAEYKRLEKMLKEAIAVEEEKVGAYEKQISQLKQERKTRSAALQLKLFGQFRMLNARGEVKDLCELFRDTPQKFPPAGAGECALPKLLQYAYQHSLRPLAMGEFWWGMSPKDEVRHHGHFYPSCQGKCAPILRHMLTGLDVEKNPLEEDVHRNTPLEVLYEDEYLLVVNKPAGMLSVPGKNDLDSVSQRLHRLYPEATGPMIVHRLDMATSGLLLAAKTKEVYQQLQAQFETRAVKKRYTALLQGELEQNEGTVSLPLGPNLMDRPRQMVDYRRGKSAVTRYEKIAFKNGNTLISFFPQTGRTHQLRVHAAHPQGLNHPIVGDELYGKKADRMYLHAAELIFVHPITGKEIQVSCEADFDFTQHHKEGSKTLYG